MSDFMNQMEALEAMLAARKKKTAPPTEKCAEYEKRLAEGDYRAGSYLADEYRKAGDTAAAKRIQRKLQEAMLTGSSDAAQEVLLLSGQMDSLAEQYKWLYIYISGATEADADEMLQDSILFMPAEAQREVVKKLRRLYTQSTNGKPYKVKVMPYCRCLNCGICKDYCPMTGDGVERRPACEETAANKLTLIRVAYNCPKERFVVVDL